MKGYREYMDRQQVSPALHDRLLALEQTVEPKPASTPRRRWQPVLAMAACLCVVLGLGWGAWSSLSGGGMFVLGSSAGSSAAADTAAPATDDSAAQSFEEAAEAAPESIEPTDQEDRLASGAACDDAAPETANLEEAGENASDGGAPESEGAKAELTPPEDALLPGWLPEGYVLTGAEALDSAHCYRLTWTDSDGCQLTLEYAYTNQAPEDSAWPVYAWSEVDWETVPQGEPRDGVWGFGLYSGDLGCYFQFTTTGEDHEALWQVAHSMVR